MESALASPVDEVSARPHTAPRQRAVIVRPLADGWLVVRQADHARLAGEMIALLRDPELVAHARRNELLRAVAEHDNGWWEEDAAPRFDPGTGGPLDFRRLPTPTRHEIWLRGIERYAAEAPYAAALIAGHCLRVLPPAASEPGREEFRASATARRDELLVAADWTLDEATRDDRWLRLGDELSLAAATADATLVALPGWRLAVEELENRIELRLAPFPWSGALTLRLEVRRIGGGPFRDAVALGRALVAAPRESLAVRLTSG